LYVRARAACLPVPYKLPELLHVRAVIAIISESDWLSTQAHRIMAEAKQEGEEAAAAAHAAAEAAAVEAAKKRRGGRSCGAAEKRGRKGRSCCCEAAGAVGEGQLQPGFVFEKGELKYVGVGQ